MKELHKELEVIDLTIADLEDQRTVLINRLDMSQQSHSRKPARIAKMDRMTRAGMTNLITFPASGKDILVSASKEQRHPW